jgi:glycosyltransferase involved in cell wall biosynthesis
MKILFDHSQPFALAHGGFQVQIEQTKRGLEASGVDVEFLRWWDPAQRGDIIHFFGRPSASYIELAHKKGMKVVLAELLTAVGSRGRLARFLQKSLIRVGQSILPAMFIHRLAWDAFAQADAIVAGTTWEAFLFEEIFGAAPEKIAHIENGVEDVFFRSASVARGKWLVCTATITERKRVVELAGAAVTAGTPLWVVGKPYSERDAYAREFSQLAKAHPDLIRYEGAIEDRARLAQVYREARGFVLLSTMETLSLSSFEAAACECPMLLSDLPWSRASFGTSARFCPITSPVRTAPILRKFYDEAASIPPPRKPKTWPEIGAAFRDLYQAILPRQ